MVDFKSLKKQSKAGSDLEKLNKALESSNFKKGSDNEDKFWKPQPDKAGNFSAEIRFLPAPPQDGEDSLPWVKVFHHGFQGPQGGWLIDNCLTTIGKEFPV